jgi:hypothetical protein
MFPFNPQVGRSTSTHDISSLTGPKNSNQLFYFPIGKCAPTTTLTRSPLYTWEIGLRNFANPVAKHWSLESPKPNNSKRYPFSFPFPDFPYREFYDHNVEQLVSPIPQSRYAETPMHSRALNFQCHLTSSGFRTSQYRKS